MESILAKLLVDDNESIKQGTALLRDALKRPENVSSLVQIIVESKNPEIRQYAVILLKKRYTKSANWFKLPREIRSDFKIAIIQCMINEPEKHVKQSIALLIGVIAKHEFPKSSWPEMLQLIEQLMFSNNVQDKLLGMFTISSMTDEAPKVFSQHTQAIITLLNNVFANIQIINADIGFYTIKVMNNMIDELSQNQDLVNAYNKLLPDVVKVIKLMSSSDPRKAVESLELLENLCEFNISIIVNHLTLVVQTCLDLANDASLDEELRAKAINIIGWLTKAKKKAIKKHKLIKPIIGAVFNLLLTKPQDENNEQYFPGEDDEDVLVACASETLDILALNLPPESLVPHLLCFVEPSLTGSDIYAKKAAYLSIAILAEGCSEYVRTKYLQSFIRCICEGIVDPASVVRNAALFALGQFAEFLQPDVSTYSSMLLPVLFEYLHQICNDVKENRKDPPSLDRIFYALEEFCENLELELLPYLPTLMERLFDILSYPNTSVHLRELALSAIGAAANACKEHMAPYFEKIIHILNPYLWDTKTDDHDAMQLKIQAVDTLGVLARTIGKETFAPIAQKVLEFAVTILSNTADPDLRKTTFGLCASLSRIMLVEIVPVLPLIVKTMMDSIKNTEGIVNHFKDDDTAAYPLIEDSDENEDEDIENTDNEDDSDDDGPVRYTVENSYISEKEEAILAFREIAENMGEHFNPYLENCFKEIFEFISYPQEDIREAAVEAVTQFVINFWNIKTEEGSRATQNALAILMPKLSTIIRLDEEHKVVIAATNSLSKLLKTLKQDVLVGAGHKEAIMTCIKHILEGDTVCQDNANEGDAGGETAKSEQDELLIEYAGELLANFGKAAALDDFTQCFKDNLPTLMNIFSSNENTGRRIVVGTIAECFEGLKENIRLFPDLFQFFINCSKNSDEEIRNNAIYGIGEMALHGKEVMFPCYMDILMHFSDGISNEVHPGARDNIVGAIARLIITNHSILPLPKIYPTFIQQLPLKQDFAEYKAVYESVLLLYRAGNPELQMQMKPLIKVAIAALNEPKLEDGDCRAVILEFLSCAQKDFLQVWSEALSEIPVDQHTILTKHFSS